MPSVMASFATRSSPFSPWRAETADREQRSIDGDRRNGGVDARAIGQARIDQRRRFVDAASHARNDLFDDAQQVRVVLEFHRRAVEFAAALHIDQVRRGDQNVRYRGVLQQRLERTQAEDFVEDLLDDAVLLDQARAASSPPRPAWRRPRGSRRARARPPSRTSASRLMRSSSLLVERELQLLVFGSVALPVKEPINPSGFAVLAWFLG